MTTTAMFPDHLGNTHDEFYEMLIALHQGLSDDASQKLNARLVLMLANEVGEVKRLEQILQRAKNSGGL